MVPPEVSRGTKACFSPSSSNFLGISGFLPTNKTVCTLISISFFRRATLDLQWWIKGFLTYYIAYTSQLGSGDGIQTCMTTCRHKSWLSLPPNAHCSCWCGLGFFEYAVLRTMMIRQLIDHICKPVCILRILLVLLIWCSLCLYILFLSVDEAGYSNTWSFLQHFLCWLSETFLLNKETIKRS